jgi:diguanylate cyclase (GGDEF)-like protein/PAS domain S-box-containing protein
MLQEWVGPAANHAALPKGDECMVVGYERAVCQIELQLQNDELRASRSALKASRERYLHLYDFAPVSYFSLNSDGLIVRGNVMAAGLLGLPRVGLLQRLFSSFIFEEDQHLYANLHNQLLASRQSQSSELRMRDGAGVPFWVDLATSFAESEDGAAVLRVVVTNIAQRKQTETKLRQAASVFTHSAEGILITTSDGTIVDVNDAFCRNTGYGRDELLNQNPRMFRSDRQDVDFYRNLWAALGEHGQWRGELWNQRKNGESYAELLTINAVHDAQGDTHHFVALYSDITAIKEHQRHLEHIAHFDALTKLPNRLLLADRLQQAMAQAERRGQHVAVAYLDLDGFKATNDRYGHDVGDQLLIQLANAMKDTLREGDTLARLGGDEFVAVIVDLDGIEGCAPLLNRLLEAVMSPVHVDGLVLRGSASIGVAFYPQGNAIEADQLLRQADQAMYQAKLAGRNRFHIFDAVQDSSLRFHHESLERMGQAIAQGEFVLHYQPKVNMHSGQVIGAEALIRWQHPEKGLLLPAAFLPLVEDHQLAVDLGEWVIDTALTQIGLWSAAGLDLPVSVNVGARQLQHGDFVARLRTIMAMHPQVSPASLELELLETSALIDIEQVSTVIAHCQEMGVKFALDDFGTGYSSLTYLKRLHVTLLKIDQSFVRDMLDNPDDLAILQGVIGLAASFHCEVIAEGVETVAHGTALMHLGCKLAQGYGIARPMPAERLPEWANSWKPDTAWSALASVDRAARSSDIWALAKRLFASESMQRAKASANAAASR